MKTIRIAALTAFATLLAGAAFADSLPMDTPVTMDGLETVCTGIGSGKDDPRWPSYPVRVEFSNGGAQYLAGVHLTLAGQGKTLASFDCIGSWVLFKLPAGSYKVTATLTGQPGGATRSTMFKTSGSGAQQRVEVQFPKLSANQ
jgi:hypothetical protein